jgi:hypothetical protein
MWSKFKRPLVYKNSMKAVIHLISQKHHKIIALNKLTQVEHILFDLE